MVSQSKNPHFIYTFLCFLLLNACGTFKVRDKKPDEVAGIHSVALVAMTLEEPVPKELAFNLDSGKVEGDRGMGKFGQKSDHAEAMYQELHRALAVRMKWKVQNKDTMIANPGYKSAYKSTMEGWQNKMPPGEGHVQYVVKDVLDYDAIRIMGQEGRDKLLADLKVDAIFVSRITVGLGGTSIMGFGPRHPYSTLNFQVYKKGISAPVWFDGNVKGKEGDSVGATAIWSEEKLQRYALESAVDAFAKIDQERK
jgi:hypothetical protein